MPATPSPPVGFTRAYEQPYTPVSVNFPGMFSMISIHEASSDSGNVMRLYEKLGDNALNIPRYIPFEDYFKNRMQYDVNNMWYKKVAMTDTLYHIDPMQQQGRQSLEIIGADIAGQRVALRIRGLISITGKYNQQNNSIMATGNMENEQKNFLMDQTQQFTIEGTIGDRITISIDEDSERDFEFENAIKIDYRGKEDEIIQRANFGNIGLSLPGTRFVTGTSSSSGLFGGKALMKFGPVDVTAIASYEKKDSKKKSWGGAAGDDGGSKIKIFDYEYKRNIYFFIDEFFRKEMYPYDLQSGKFTYSDMIEDYNVYISCNEREDTKMKAVAFVDLSPDGTPTVSTEHPEEDVADSIYFRKLEKPTSEQIGEYEINPYQGYIRLSVGLNDNSILAIAYKTSSGKKYGDLQNGKYLKIIKAENPKPNYKTWDLEMRNIYDLKARNIDKEDFELKVFYNGANQAMEYINGIPYLRYFDLDNYNQNGVPGNDGRIDLTPEGLVVDLERGELWMPYVLPFQAPPQDNNTEGIYNENLRSEDDSELPSAGEIYNNSYNDPDRLARKYYIEVQYSNRSSTIDLGEMFIIEGSEEILISGKKMTRGVDYDIDYFSGIITLKSAEAMDANAKIDINYETEQMFGGIGEQKFMTGMRAEYRLNENAFLGATAMYYKRSVLDDKNVNIGDEPFQNFIWDINGELAYELDWLDRAMNALPKVHIKRQSSMKFSGEIAQILPNPNTIENKASGDYDGVAKLDDFESASQKTPMNINFQKWTHASKPENTFFASSFKERGFMFWYNPFYVDNNGSKIFGIYTKYIWPQKEVTETDQYTNVLSVVLDPEVNGITGKETLNDTRQIWGGIMQPVYMYDQSKSKYIEIWVRGEKGQLQIDIGEITEDWYNTNYDPAIPDTEYGDGILNQEDLNNNGNLEISTNYNEDIGINGLTDEEEEQRGWDPMVDNFDKEGYKEGEVRFCNGTEGNAGTDGIQPYPDTEDIDRDGKLDQANNYYSYTVDLGSDQWLASKTYFDNGDPTGWKQYRIPLTAVVDSVGMPNFMSIRMMRMSMFNVEDQDTVQFASVSIVGNEWQERGLAGQDDNFFTPDDDRFFITVKNTDEDADYISPPGISGREHVSPLDGTTIKEKEQALVLNLDGLKPGETALAEKIMLESKTLLMYKKLKMFIHGDENDPVTDSPVRLFLRIGRGDMEEYYEAVTEVYPGWDERNDIEMIFEEITQLKNRVDFDGIEYFKYDDGNIREYRKRDPDTEEYTGKIYRVVGNPSLSRIEKMQVGVRNADNFRNYAGEIWINEMRVAESNNDPGTAMRGSFDFNLGGLFNFNANARRTDADFRQVNQQQLNNQTTKESYNLIMTVYADKLLPDDWNVSMPVNISQNQSQSTPKYYPGSDIPLRDEPEDSLKSISNSHSVSTSLRRSGENDDPLLTRVLINPLQASFNASTVKNSSLEIENQQNRSMNGKLSYQLNIKKGEGISFLSWIPFLNEESKEQKFYWKPSSFRWNMNISERDNEKITRSTQDTISSYSFNMSKNMSLNYDPFQSMKISYSRSTNSDLQDYRYDTWRIFTDVRYDSLMNGVNVGEVTQLTENVNVNYNPEISVWLKPRLSYSSGYKYNTQNNWNYANVSVTRSITASTSLSLKQIWDTYEKKISEYRKSREQEKEKTAKKEEDKPPPKKKIQRNEGDADLTARPEPKQREETEKKEKRKFKIDISELIGKIDPVRINYTDDFQKSNSGIISSDTSRIYKDVTYKYRYGFGGYDYLPTERFEGSITRPFTNRLSRSLRLSSGVKLTRSISLRLDYKQNMSTGRQYQFKTTSGDYYDEIVHIIAFEDTLELLPYDSSVTRNFFPAGPTGKDGFPAPNYSLTWRINPGQYKWLKGKLNFIKSINLQHQMSSSESVRYRFNEDDGQYYIGEESSTYTLSFSPLIKAGFSFSGNLRTDIGYNRTIKTDNRGDVLLNYSNASITKTFQDNMTLNLSYSYNKGITIPVPFVKNIDVINMKNEITFSLQGKYGVDKKIVKSSGAAEFGDPKNFRVNWEIEPQLSYRFSKNIDGRFFFKYGQRIDKTQILDGEHKKDDYKDFGVTVTIRIQG
ncbi:MAG: cell surface protein SprA [Fidelibacterota bacterium]